jgi:aminoglycoside 6'-N-acetyltransferase
MTAPLLTLRATANSDRFRLQRWLGEPHVQAWWGPRATAEAKIAAARASPGAVICIVEIDGMAAGYAHALDVSDAWGVPPPEVPPGAYEIDLFLGEVAYIGRDFGRRGIALLLAEVFATTLAVACAAIVPLRNERAVRIYEKAGLRWQRVWTPPGGEPSWIMLVSRPQTAGQA